MTDGTGTSTYAYDSRDRLLTTTDGLGQQTTNRYDLRGQLTSLTYPSGAVVSKSYDDAGRLTGVTDWAGHTSRFTYNADSDLISEVLGNGIRGTLTYDASRNLLGIRYVPPSGQSGGALLGWTYQRDALGRLTAISPASTASGPAQSYSYDSANRLTTEANFINLTYKYDASDNLIKVTGAGEDPLGTATSTYDAAHQLVQTVIQHNQQTVASFSFTYDASGNRTQVKSGTGSVRASYAYDQANRLIGFTAGGSAASYAYNGDGLRASKTVGGATQKFAWDFSQGLPLVLADGKAQYIYGPDGQPLEQIGGDGHPHYFLGDHQGSTRALAGQNGRLESTFQFDAYGQLISFGASPSSPLLFTGQYLDVESNLYYLRSRMYDPLTGQFTSRDPLSARTREPYAYTANNPVNSTDPSGLYEYHMSFNLGYWGPTADTTAMQIMQSRPSNVFPWPIAGTKGETSIQMGSEYTLTDKPLPFHDTDQVKVTGMTATSFTFTALKYHIEGEGGTIRFSTHLNGKCDLVLQMDAQGPDPFGVAIGPLQDARLSKAKEFWSTMRDKVWGELDQTAGI